MIAHLLNRNDILIFFVIMQQKFVYLTCFLSIIMVDF